MFRRRLSLFPGLPLFNGAIVLRLVARPAGWGDVAEAMCAALGEWDDMVHLHVIGLCFAVCAAEVCCYKNGEPVRGREWFITGILEFPGPAITFAFVVVDPGTDWFGHL